MTRLIIVGAGASGMMAAISAAKANKDIDIIILEHGAKPGRKILATGNGRCNLTNEKLDNHILQYLLIQSLLLLYQVLLLFL